jgi:hypothetical protein
MDSDDIAYPDRDVADARAYLLAADLYRRFAFVPRVRGRASSPAARAEGRGALGCNEERSEPA